VGFYQYIDIPKVALAYVAVYILNQGYTFKGDNGDIIFGENSVNLKELFVEENIAGY
jgi:hypothetical protein